jgi:RNA polymerase sigma factor (sigma-70 family)
MSHGPAHKEDCDHAMGLEHSGSSGGQSQIRELQDRAWWDLARSSDDDSALHAFGCLYQRYRGPLIKLAARLCTRDDAEDIVHTVFSDIWASRATVNIHGSVRLYLRGAVWNCARKLWRDGRHSVPLSSLGSAPADIEQTVEPEEQTDPETVRLILSKVDQLPLRQRIVLLLRVNEMSYADIGSVLHISENTVDTLLYRARRRLRAL